MRSKLTQFTYFLAFVFSLETYAQVDKPLFHQVFGQKQKSHKLLVPIYFKNIFIGDVKSIVKGSELLFVDRKSFLETYSSITSSSHLLQLKKELVSKKISINDLLSKKILLEYNESKLSCRLSIPVGFEKTKISNASSEVPSWAKGYLMPQDVSFVMNFDLQEHFGSSSEQESYFRGDFEPVLNINGIVFENEFFYQSLYDENKLKRKSSRIVYDDDQNLMRYSLGDIEFTALGYQEYKTLLGFSITKEFSLNPYQVITPLNKQEFILRKRSLVRVFVNSRLIKVDYLNAGKHSIEDLPLSSGLNKVLIEVDDGVKIKKYEFNRAASSELLSKGLSRYSISSGIESDKNFEEKKYLNNSDLILNARIEHGVSDLLTLGLYVQGDKTNQIGSLNGIKATEYGNFNFDTAISSSESIDYAYKLNYSLMNLGSDSNLDYRVNLGLEWLGEDFRTISQVNTASDNRYRFDISVSTNITTNASVSISSFYNISRDVTKNNPYGLNIALDSRFHESFTSSIFAGRERQNDGKWNNSLYFFFNFNLPENNTYINSFYDSENNIKRANIRYQSPKKINATNARATIAKAKDLETYEAEIERKTIFGNFNIGHIKENHSALRSSSRSNLRYQGSLLMASNNFAISAPVGNSFALIKTNEHLDGQKLSLKSYSQYSEGNNNLFDTIVISDLSAYHYRRFQFDTTYLDNGRQLKNENFVLFSGYRTGHFLSVGEPGVVTYIGKINKKGSPFGLKVCSIRSLDQSYNEQVFTNKKGRFVIEGLKPDTYEVFCKDRKIFTFKIKKGQSGIVKGPRVEIDK